LEVARKEVEKLAKEHAIHYASKRVPVTDVINKEAWGEAKLSALRRILRMRDDQEYLHTVEHALPRGSDDKVRWLSCSVPGATAWLRALPTCWELQMSNSQFTVSARQHLGLRSVEHFGVTKTDMCACGRPEVELDDYHLQTCKDRYRISQRHNEINRVIAQMITSTHMQVKLEPPVEVVGGPRADIKVIDWENGKDLLIDTSVVHSLCYGDKVANYTPFYSGRKMEQAKWDKYNALLKNLRDVLVFKPAIMETFGGMGRDLRQIVLACSHRVGNRVPQQQVTFVEYYTQRIAVALRRALYRQQAEAAEAARAVRRHIPGMYPNDIPGTLMH
jgi:hypothetical protein